MTGWLGAAYPWIKAAHLIFVIFWIAGLFMLPRHYVYHHAIRPGTPEDLLWIDREKKLVSIILNPSLVLVWIFGLALALDIGAFNQGWFHAKLLLVVAMSGYHGWAVGYQRKLEHGLRPLDERTLRIMNEVPGIATALIVVLVIVKPF